MSRHLSVIRFPRRLRRDDRGEAIVGFAFVLPVLVLLSLAIFEFSLVMFDFHRAGEATRRAVRSVAIKRTTGIVVVASTEKVMLSSMFRSASTSAHPETRYAPEPSRVPVLTRLATMVRTCAVKGKLLRPANRAPARKPFSTALAW